MLPKGPYDSTKTEPEILKFWLENKYFKPEYHSEKGLLDADQMKQDDRETFCIINPPPNAYMRPHIGNVSGYAYQDAFLRYNRMLGKKVLGQPGKDHAGIQGEVTVDKIFQNERGKDKQEMGREGLLLSSSSLFGDVIQTRRFCIFSYMDCSRRELNRQFKPDELGCPFQI